MQKSDWETRVGDRWAALWRRTDGTFAPVEGELERVIAGLAPTTGRFLDIGCGVGTTSLALASMHPGAAVTGVDLSPAMIAVARERAADIPNLTFDVADLAAWQAEPFDLLASRHGVMFFEDPVAGFRALRRLAQPDAPLVFSCFRSLDANPWAREVAAAVAEAPIAADATGYTPGPFAFADPASVGDLLARSGWTQAVPQRFDYAYEVGEGEDAVEQATAFFSRIGPAARALATLDAAASAAARERLRATLAARMTDGRVSFPAGAWIWTARAGEPA